MTRARTACQIAALCLLLLALLSACVPASALAPAAPATAPAPADTPVTASPTSTLPPAPTMTLTRPPDPTATISPSPTASVAPFTPIRAIRLDFADYAKSRALIDGLEAQMKQSGVNLVALGAGRVDWTFFQWDGHKAQWSSAVSDSGIDFLAQDAARFHQWARVNAVVDVYAPRYIQQHPEKAARSWLGQPSQYLVNTVELVDGEYGALLLEMIDAIAAHYPVDSISITEMMYYTEGYSDPDKASYMAYAGKKDWPRLDNGLVNIDNPSIGEWRSHEIALFLQKARAITQKYGKELYIDASVTWGAAGDLGQRTGTRYDVLLQQADRIVLWDYFALNGYTPEYAQEIARVVRPLDPKRVILSVGLWAKNNGTISPDELARALQSARTSGLTNLWVTPSLMLTPDLWGVIGQQYR